MTARGLMAAVLLSACMLPLAMARGAVTRIEIRSRQPYAQGREFPGVGAYETLRGKVFFEVDPDAPANKQVVDLELAPRNAAGRVEFSADLELLTPVDRRRGNGALLYDVNNRGNKVALGQFNAGADEFLLRRGFTIAWSGWIAETAPGGGRLRLQAPVALQNGQPLVGVVRAEMVVDAPTAQANVAQWANQGSYEPTPRGERDATLTTRLLESDTRIPVPQPWRLVKSWPEADGERAQLPTLMLELPAGLQPGRLYELIYEAQGSLVQGVGLAGIRDLVSFLRYDSSAHNPLSLDDASVDGGRRSAISRTHGFGVSQSGRCLRQFLYDGFNADESGRQVFDGLIPHVAGAGMGFFNHRFASPTRHNAQHDNHLFPADQFPFTYGDEHDPLSGREDGLLRRARAARVVPKVMHTQSSSEYWHRGGSLVQTDPLGRRDAEIPAEVRIYAFGGTQHGPGNGLPAAARGNGQLLGNPADYRPLMRALLTALDAWIKDEIAPPPSIYPKIADGTAAGWRESESGWRPLPGVRYPTVIQRPELLDRGPDFLARRIATIEPPVRRGEYVVRVPAYDADNRERGTLDLPAVAVPVATYTSWNLRYASIGAETELLSLAGGYIRLAKTADERRTNGDPRRSLAELYRDREAYRMEYRTAVDRLARDRYVLEEDRPALEALGDKLW